MTDFDIVREAVAYAVDARGDFTDALAALDRIERAAKETEEAFTEWAMAADGRGWQYHPVTRMVNAIAALRDALREA